MKRICLIICILLGMAAQAQEKETLVLIKTTKGDIKVKLYNDTPLHRDNFIKVGTTTHHSIVLSISL